MAKAWRCGLLLLLLALPSGDALTFNVDPAKVRTPRCAPAVAPARGRACAASAWTVRTIAAPRARGARGAPAGRLRRVPVCGEAGGPRRMQHATVCVPAAAPAWTARDSRRCSVLTACARGRCVDRRSACLMRSTAAPK